MAVVLKITYGGDVFRLVLKDRPSFDAVDAAVQQLKPGAPATFADAAGPPRRLSAASFERFLATARVGAGGRQVLRLQLARPPTATAAVAAEAPPQVEPAIAQAPRRSPAPAAGLFPALRGKRVAIMPRGSRGDVQPFVTLGSRLMAEGCRVLVLTNADHLDFVAKFGMEAVGVARDCRKEFESPEFQHAFATGDWGPAGAKKRRLDVNELPAMIVQELAALREFAPDLIYATPLAEVRAWFYSNVLEVPMLLGSLQPIEEGLSRGAEMVRCGMCWKRTEVEFAILKNVVRRELPEPKFDPAWATFWSYRLWKMRSPHPVLVHWSPALNEVPARKRQTHRLTGFLVLERPQQEERFRSCDSTFGGDALRELQAFLDAGERPVYMGWGSVVVVSPEHMARLAVRALRGAGLRGVVLGGWAGLAPHMLEGLPDAEELLAYARERVLFVQSAPHEWLFPRCAATVHHGGAGTTAAALRAGVPTVVTPCGLDQPGNARRVQESGCGIALEHFPRVTPEVLAAALTRCAADKQMAAKCKAMGELLRAEDGAGSAVAEVERFLREEVSTGIWRGRAEDLRARMARASSGPPGPPAGPASRRGSAKASGRQGRW